MLRVWPILKPWISLVKLQCQLRTNVISWHFTYENTFEVDLIWYLQLIVASGADAYRLCPKLTSLKPPLSLSLKGFFLFFGIHRLLRPLANGFHRRLVRWMSKIFRLEIIAIQLPCKVNIKPAGSDLQSFCKAAKGVTAQSVKLECGHGIERTRCGVTTWMTVEKAKGTGEICFFNELQSKEPE